MCPACMSSEPQQRPGRPQAIPMAPQEHRQALHSLTQPQGCRSDVGAWAFYGSMKYLLLSCLKQHTFITSRFPLVRSLGRSPLLRVSQGCSQDVGQAGVLNEAGAFFQVHRVVGRIYFLAAIGLRFPFSYWLPAEGCSLIIIIIVIASMIE